MNTHTRFSRRTGLTALAALLIGGSLTGRAQKRYGPGVTDTEIKIGNTSPYSGPGSAYGAIAKMHAAYFRMINEKGGVNGRRINYLSYDDALSPPKTVEQTRKLVEQDQVLAVFNSVGTAANLAVQKYLNNKKVPQLMIGAGSTRLIDPKTFPWTIGWQPTYHSEGAIYAKYILANIPDARVAILSQNDDFGRDYLGGLKAGFGDKAKSLIVSETTYEPTDATVDSQILKMKASGANVLVNITTPKFAAQTIKKVAEIGWKPTHFLTSISISMGAVMRPAGRENGQGIISAAYLMEATDDRWKDYPEMREWNAFMDKYLPDANKADWMNVFGYVAAQALVHVLQQCGDDLSRENLMKQAASMKNVRFKLMLPGIFANSSDKNFFPVRQLQMVRLNGQKWEPFGSVMRSDE
ncbi:branched-chain amino acid transport system substrate-binding protein [Variovorax boronicumulans]|uniref:Branched-chain amino acid transport system substrate-binding protein n=1 Tax=Variovorax boronicumulans TaxID=436515 RepID=A0AAW8DUQ2_9BURK|nr:ABC transporter substrate-binding protein [Variovorax boronicumulans]MDP9877909.1 branched-chain amino acid transport system substrate-binding protein [Variovorax boronicumulans]MDP9923193.1 branched-chain amino acid transport system substrate-binding protein [Variovorax boronicumulans]